MGEVHGALQPLARLGADRHPKGRPPQRRGTAGDDIYRDADIYGYDLDTGEERVICDARGSQVNPDISGFWVVWTDCRRGADDSDIYGCNLETREGLAVCRDPGKQMNPLLPAD
ncbi:MAG: hypothetical protein GX624_08730 [Actinobacteria bacterium]|nr:hypothetical protein [Actinomycetota bacterium]